MHIYLQVNDLWVLTLNYLWVNSGPMETLRIYLNELSVTDQSAFAESCGTSVGYLRKAISTDQKLGEGLAIAIERETKGKVRCEELRPDVDWEFLRGTTKSRKSVAARA